MQRSNWREEIQISEFRTGYAPADAIIGAGVAAFKLGQNPIVKK